MAKMAWPVIVSEKDCNILFDLQELPETEEFTADAVVLCSTGIKRHRLLEPDVAEW